MTTHINYSETGSKSLLIIAQMFTRNMIKIALVSVITLLVASCSSTPEKGAEASTTPSVTYSKAKQKQKHTPWEQAYNESLDDTENPLSSENPPITLPPQPPTDIWDRIRDGFVISDYKTLEPDTERQLRWFIDHQDYVGRVVERARPYLFHIVEEVNKRNMPMEVALLPVVESGFKPMAYSPSHASGLWQFIPGTGQVYGLEQNWWYDGRRDVVKSTQAALDYLEKLHNDFGDWQLALAAYNCGEGTVGRAIKKNQEQGKPTDFWSLDLPRETSAYVPRLMAVSHMVKYPERYELELSPIDNKPFFGQVNVGSQIDLAMAAKLAGITEKQLHQLNPAFNRWATAPQGDHKLVLPLEKIPTFKSALAKMPASQRVQWARHEIQRGESLSVIARNYDTTVEVIKQANKLGGTQIRAGKNLLIPVASHNVSQLALNKVQKNSPQEKTKKTTYIVKAGDTWWDIARKNNIDVQSLTKQNKKSARDILHTGQKLVITTTVADIRKSVNYTIRDGDSLWAISRKFNVSVADVREWNGLSDRSTLQPGQSLKLYIDET
jgi:membrane-bound lytic murein transglycosylase D